MKIDAKDLQFAKVAIAAAVKKRTRRGIIRREEQEDVRGELMRRLLSAWGRYDPARGPREAFINRVVATQLVSIQRAKRAKKRGGATRSIDEVAEPMLDANSWEGRRQRVCDLSIELPAVLKMLSPLQRDIVDHLGREPLKLAAQEMGISCRILRDQRDRIREIFEICGLGDMCTERRRAVRVLRRWEVARSTP